VKTINDAEDTVKEKPQTQAQRVSNAVWLREQLQGLINNCDEDIQEDQERAGRTGCVDAQDKYLGLIDSHRYWKRQLERILDGKTFAEALEENRKHAGVDQ
jgi:hypothetical protein